MMRIRILTVLLAGTAIMSAGSGAYAATTTVDFADSAGSSGSFTSRGYDFNSNGWVLSINPNYEHVNFGGPYNFTMTETGAQTFDLHQLYILLTTSSVSDASAIVDFTGHLKAGGIVTRQINMYSICYDGGPCVFDYRTVFFDRAWRDLTSLVVNVSPTNISFSSTIFDNIVVRSGQLVGADIDVDTPPAVHPHHDGGPGAIAGLNDVIEVVVMGLSSAAGDRADLDTDDIDPASLKFGPTQGLVDPSSTPEYNVNYDGDGIDDARFHFLTGDTGISCLDTEVTLTGSTTGGDDFEGTDLAFVTDCDALCHD